LGWFAMIAARSDHSPIFRAQLRARMVKLVFSLFVQTTLTIAVLAKDPAVSIWLDGIGAAFVAFMMISVGVKMTRSARRTCWTIAFPTVCKNSSGAFSRRLGFSRTNWWG
jgi:hypothetical protein